MRRVGQAVLVVLVLMVGCGGGPGDDPDAGPEAGQEASVKDVEVTDVRIPDARVDSQWCGEIEFPGVDPNAQELTTDPPAPMQGFSWDASLIVYSRSEPGPPTPGMDYEIYMFDLDSWNELRITEIPDSWQIDPSIYEGHIIWTDGRYRVVGIEDYRFELIEYEISSGQETRLTDSPDSKFWPHYNGEYVVYARYQEGSGVGQTELLRVADGETTILSPVGSAAEGESIGDRYVAWVALPPDSQYWNKDVYIFDLQTTGTSHLTSTSNSLAYNTGVSDGRVVWQDDRNGNWDIYLYDIEIQQEMRLTEDPFDQVVPRINGNLVTWNEFRYTGGWFDGSECAWDLYILDITTMVGRRVTNIPWFWFGRVGEGGRLVAALYDRPINESPAKLYLFDLIEMGILDATGQHVLPE